LNDKERKIDFLNSDLEFFHKKWVNNFLIKWWLGVFNYHRSKV